MEIAGKQHDRKSNIYILPESGRKKTKRNKLYTKTADRGVFRSSDSESSLNLVLSFLGFFATQDILTPPASSLSFSHYYTTGQLPDYRYQNR